MRKFRPLDIFSDCTVRFVSDLVENPKDRFSHNEAQNGPHTDNYTIDINAYMYIIFE